MYDAQAGYYNEAIETTKSFQTVIPPRQLPRSDNRQNTEAPPTDVIHKRGNKF